MYIEYSVLHQFFIAKHQMSVDINRVILGQKDPHSMCTVTDHTKHNQIKCSSTCVNAKFYL